eukprot:tig00020830_g14514.t1
MEPTSSSGRRSRPSLKKQLASEENEPDEEELEEARRSKSSAGPSRRRRKSAEDEDAEARGDSDGELSDGGDPEDDGKKKGKRASGAKRGGGSGRGRGRGGGGRGGARKRDAAEPGPPPDAIQPEESVAAGELALPSVPEPSAPVPVAAGAVAKKKKSDRESVMTDEKQQQHVERLLSREVDRIREWLKRQTETPQEDLLPRAHDAMVFATFPDGSQAEEHIRSLWMEGHLFAIMNDVDNEVLGDHTPLKRVGFGGALTLFDDGILFDSPANRERKAEVVLGAGGPVWAMDWCPMPPPVQDKEGMQDQYLAVGVHKPDEALHKIGTAYADRTAIQVWRIGAPSQEGQQEVMGIMELLILHDFGCAWSLRWCPAPMRACVVGGPQNLVTRLGVLAGTFGDGTLRLLAVPSPYCAAINAPRPRPRTGYLRRAVAARGRCSSARTASGCTALHLRPLATLTVPNTLVWSCDWCPTSPDLLAGGCTDGSVALWRVTDGGERPSPLWHVRGHAAPVRSVCWCPGSDFLFATGGHDGRVMVWDRRDAFEPLFRHHVGRGWVVDMSWPHYSPGVVLAMDDTLIRHLDFRDCAAHVAPYHSGNLWSVSGSHVTQRFASGGADGRIVVWSLPAFELKLKHLAERPVLREAARVRWLQEERLMIFSARPGEPRVHVSQLSKDEATGGEGSSGGKTEHDLSISVHAQRRVMSVVNASSEGQPLSLKEFPPLEGAVDRVCFNRNPNGARWLAVGLACGYVRCLWI